MASNADILTVRNYTGVTVEDRSDADISALIDGSSILQASASIWDGIAAASASLVDVTESNSSRKLGDVYKNAVAMATYFREQETTAAAPVETTATRTRRAVRG